jgi:G6PDH family F420-dependent oxidoreductase
MPNDLVENAVKAEAAGFSFALISDHFHPWVDAQGQSPFVWSVIGGIAHATTTLRLGTGVTCPTIRIHPAIVAQAVATSAAMMPGRFFFGVGTGENLNEHILGDRWPSANERRAMMEEAIDLMRTLWQGGLQSYDGLYYRVVDARLYTLPESPIQVYIAASGKMAAELAGSIGDGLINTKSDSEIVKAFESTGGTGKPKIGQFACCWAENGDEAKETAYRIWPNAGIAGELSQELPLPRHFEQAAEMVTPDQIAEAIPLGPDPQRYIEMIEEYVKAGYDHVYIHQIGPDQDGFFRFYEREIAPKFS